MTDFQTIERIARQLCEERGLDFDAKHRKRAHWIAEAQKLAALAEVHTAMPALMRACGWKL